MDTFPSIKRVGVNEHVVQDTGKSWLLNEAGVSCLNPNAAEGERVYQKTFVRKKVYLPEKYDLAKREHLRGRHPFIVGVNGYTSLSSDVERAWGLEPGAYFAGVEILLKHAINRIRKEYRDCQVIFVHGASVGVDEVGSHVATALNLEQLGFSCPEYMFYVADNDVPVYVAPDKDEYAKSFIRSLDVLIACNGRQHSFEMDYKAIMEFDKRVILVNVLKSISKNGGPPPKDAKGKVQDAVAHFMHCLRLVGTSSHVRGGTNRPWVDACKEVGDHLTQLCSESLPARIGLAFAEE